MSHFCLFNANAFKCSSFLLAPYLLFYGVHHLKHIRSLFTVDPLHCTTSPGFTVTCYPRFQRIVIVPSGQATHTWMRCTTKHHSYPMAFFHVCPSNMKRQLNGTSTTCHLIIHQSHFPWLCSKALLFAAENHATFSILNFYDTSELFVSWSLSFSGITRCTSFW